MHEVVIKPLLFRLYRELADDKPAKHFWSAVQAKSAMLARACNWQVGFEMSQSRAAMCSCQLWSIEALLAKD